MKPTLTRGKYTEKIMQFADHLGFLYIKHLVYHKKLLASVFGAYIRILAQEIPFQK